MKYYVYLKENILENAQLTLQSLVDLFKFLFNDKRINKSFFQEVNYIYKQIFEIFDELQFNSMNPLEVEEKVSELFENYFSGKLKVNEFVDIIKKYKDSNAILENQILSYLIYSVIDEYKFFNNYPNEKLKLMSVFYGQLFLNGFLWNIAESVTLNYILLSLSKRMSLNK